MNVRMLVLAAFVSAPIALYAHDDPHHGTIPGMMQGKAEGGRSGAGAQAQSVGKPGNPKKVSRTIQVSMGDDMKFTPAQINVKRGETIRFALRNVGRIKHEMVIGTMAELKQHAELMRKMPGMEHADPNMVTLEPGKSGELI